MRRMMLAALVAGTLHGRARAADQISAADRAAIDQVITAQIEAFRHDDGDTAFGLAAPNIRRKFGDGAHFMAVVREAYPPVFRPQAFTFGAVASDGGAITQKVEIIGPDGRAALAVYDMEREPDGQWRIAGCSLTKSEQMAI